MFEYDLTKYYNNNFKIAGVDEVGRGPLAGPVVSCAIIMPNDKFIEGIKDSKKLTEKKRIALDEEIRQEAIAIGIGVVDERTIDEINIKQATRLAMKIAVENLQDKNGKNLSPDVTFIDAENIDLNIRQESLIKGDDICYPIACASIVAKVYRDNLFIDFDKEYPGYDFLNNKGYGTKKHREAILELGVTPIHRHSFLKKLLGKK
ncbi:ribonuclease HII [Miniphocaeibacter halophilus]|uniref:Ribonuclease HII n=1 Tax=Miniphocaeibacter halophilus TaxID=2931922 RepID=A0AC61MX13_9FIRM|nr:ribonuclease HII [Miniphocaeibacter halophilus]QQK07313.1 ribonuclease HII [Miniphocaeibacter halophilus]